MSCSVCEGYSSYNCPCCGPQIEKIVCPECDGSGEDEHGFTCDVCHGHGEVWETEEGEFIPV